MEIRFCNWLSLWLAQGDVEKSIFIFGPGYGLWFHVDVHFMWFYRRHMRLVFKPNCFDEIGKKKGCRKYWNLRKIQFVADIRFILNLHKSSVWPNFEVIQSVLFKLNVTFACHVLKFRLSIETCPVLYFVSVYHCY